jgi:hypothetical protein
MKRIVFQGPWIQASACLLASVFFSSACAENLRFPAATVMNVKTQFGAAGNNSTNDQPAIQRAIDTAMVNHTTIYFPNGTYLVRDKITFDTSMYTAQGICLQGQSQNGVVIKLADNATGYGDPIVRKPLCSMFEGLYSNIAMHCYVRNMTFDAGSGNPGAIGLQYMVSNIGAVYNVTIRSSDPQHRGAIGLDCRDFFVGPGLVLQRKLFNSSEFHQSPFTM